jgi:16S rRNA (uracil1498-N3)-methyltransferase
MIQKATELGVTKFLPIISERTIVRKINNERLNKIIIESCEQSNRINVPSIEKSQSLEKFLSDNLDINLIFGDLNTKNKKIKFYNSKPNCLLIGPEGDYSSNEIKKILNYKGSQSIKLSDNILRSETAVISALSVINYLQN